MPELVDYCIKNNLSLLFKIKQLITIIKYFVKLKITSINANQTYKNKKVRINESPCIENKSTTFTEKPPSDIL